VTTPVGPRRKVGEMVGLTLDPSACVMLADDSG
jgi:hypothetical protein